MKLPALVEPVFATASFSPCFPIASGADDLVRGDSNTLRQRSFKTGESRWLKLRAPRLPISSSLVFGGRPRRRLMQGPDITCRQTDRWSSSSRSRPDSPLSRTGSSPQRDPHANEPPFLGDR